MKLLKLILIAKEYSLRDNTMYYVVRTLHGTLGVYNAINRPKHCTVLYNVYDTHVFNRSLV